MQFNGDTRDVITQSLCRIAMAVTGQPEGEFYDYLQFSDMDPVRFSLMAIASYLEESGGGGGGSGAELPAVTSADIGKVLTVVSSGGKIVGGAKWGVGNVLPFVDDSDNGKVLMVVGGEWQAADKTSDGTVKPKE